MSSSQETATEVTMASRPRFHDAITTATDFLAAQQSDDGAWRDFSTEVGVADCWTTAYIGLCLLSVPEPRSAGWMRSLERAADWLYAQLPRWQAWGYNTTTPPDADSTAHAILFLRHCDVELPLDVYRRLLAYQRPDGGFGTYQTPDVHDSWGASHVCVTPVALHALATCLDPLGDHFALTRRYIQKGQRTGGLWQSFWWQTPLYGTAVNLEAALELELTLDRDAVVHGLDAFEPHGFFDTALRARCYQLLGELESARLTCRTLVDGQAEDGSWPSEPILRVTRHSSFQPWQDEEAGDLHADHNRLFTSATALRSLAGVATHGATRP